MIVTQIDGVSKTRYRIAIDGQFAFVLYKGELRRYQIKEGQEISADNYREIMTELLPGRAKLRCMNLLQARDYTRKQLEAKLRQGEYSQSCIDEALAYMEAYGYIDDFRYTKDYIVCHLDGKGRMRIEAELIRRGISIDMLRQAFDELGGSGAGQDEASVVQELLRKKRYCAETATRQEQQRMYGFLYRRGFGADVIARALSL